MALCLLCSCLSALLEDLWDLLDCDSADAAFLLDALVVVPVWLLLLVDEGDESLSEMPVQPKMASAILVVVTWSLGELRKCPLAGNKCSVVQGSEATGSALWEALASSPGKSPWLASCKEDFSHEGKTKW